jgi:excisionase family DNA binding protein
MRSSTVNRLEDDPLLWTVAETARQCGVCGRTVNRWINGGHLPVVRFSPRAVRIPSAAVRAFIARQARAIVPAPLPFLENRSCAAQQLADVLRRPRPAKRR